ncbi:unnamed protein product [Phytophthora lilii]|uniref:Unnamed protein product n=1 Tax=Phytophthora lilii TaxID=2077276 RepID=A0A9W6TIP5_9STRA|nr:unnamed protein product [Phytophthora lilii]
MAIDALAADEDELGPLRRRRSSDAARREAPVLGEVTLPVMMLSMLYFLVFKWILDLVFSGVPLLVWIVSIAQVLPGDAGLSDVSIVSSGTTAAQVFTAVAFAFLAHQIGVTSARGLLFVSRNVAEVLFSRNEDDDSREQQTDRTQMDTRHGQEESHLARRSAASSYGTMGGKQPRSRQGSDASKPSAEEVTRNLYQEGRSVSAPNVYRPKTGSRDTKQKTNFDGADFPYVPPRMAPPMPPVPPMPPAPPSRELPRAERAFQIDICNRNHDQDLQTCCCNFDVKVSTGNESSDSQRGGASGGRGRGDRRRGGRGSNSGGRGGGWGWGAGRGGLRFNHMMPDGRGPPPFPPFNGEFPHWGDWREHWLQHWRSWQDWRWPDRDYRRRSTMSKGRRGIRRRNSFDDVYAIAVPVAATVPDTDDKGLKEPAHKSIYEALDLSPSAPPLPSRRSRWGSDDAQWERSTLPDIDDKDRGHHRHESMHKSMSEPVNRQSLYECWQRDEAQSDFDSSEDDREDDSRGKRDYVYTTRDLLRDRHIVHRRLTELDDNYLVDTGDSRKQTEYTDGDVAGEAEYEHVDRDDQREPKAGKFRQKHAEWKQKRYERKMQKYEMKLCAAREKSGRRHGEDENHLERYIEAKERDRYAREIEQAADEALHAPGAKQETMRMKLQSSGGAKASAPRLSVPTTDSSVLPTAPPSAQPATPAQKRHMSSMKPSGDPRKRALSSRVRSRPSTLIDQQLGSTRDKSDGADRVEQNEQEDVRPLSIASVSQAASTHDISDLEIEGSYGNITRSYEDDDVTNMRAYAPLSYTGSPPQYITALDPSPIYRGPPDQPDYDSFSPMGSPRSIDTGRDSFGDVAHDYDVLSPTNSVHDAEFSTDKFQQVYRSIQMAAVPPPRRSASILAAEEGGLDAISEFKGVPGRRDRVNFSAFAPPSVCPSPKPFQFTVWAFLLNQRAEMQELARSDHPESRKLSLETKLDVRRGALVHVTLEVPNGFEVLNGATQGFAWEGEISSAEYDVVCTDGAAFGRVLFKARITVGSSVAVLNSFVLVGSRALDPSELESDVLEGWMDVMEQTYREIPFRSLEMKELVGQGYFGDAYRASLDGQDVVVKTIRASEFGETTSQITPSSPWH